jgi:hypothetical protein
MKKTLNQDMFWMLDENRKPLKDQVAAEDVQNAVNAGDDPTLCIVGGSEWKKASELGYREMVAEVPAETADAVTPPPPPSEPEVPEVVNSIALLEQAVANAGIEESALLEWARQNKWAKPRARSIAKAFTEADAQKVLNGWDGILNILKQRAEVVAKTETTPPSEPPAPTPPAPTQTPPGIAPVAPAAPVAEAEVPAPPTAPPTAPIVAEAPAEVPPTPAPVVSVAPVVPAAPTAPTPPATTATAAAQPPAIAQSMTEMSGGAITGDFEDSDFRMPSLKIVQGNSALVGTWGAGSVLLQDQPLFPQALAGCNKREPLVMVPCAIRKQFVENLPYDPDGPQPRMLDTIDQIREEGGTTQWLGDTPPSWKPAGRLLAFVQQPDEESHPAYSHPSFTIEDEEGKMWALTVIWCRNTAYRTCAKEVLTACQGVLNNGKEILISSRLWTLTFENVKAGDYFVWTPVAKLSPKPASAGIQSEAAKLRQAFASGIGVESDAS